MILNMQLGRNAVIRCKRKKPPFYGNAEMFGTPAFVSSS